MNYLVVRFLFKHRRLDQLVEGKSTTLIEGGKVLQKNLAKELLSHSELLTVLHRQGFDDVDEVEQCVLEPQRHVCGQEEGAGAGRCSICGADPQAGDHRFPANGAGRRKKHLKRLPEST